MCQLLGMNCAEPTDVTFSFTGFAARGGVTDHHADFIIALSIVVFIISSKGFSVLYLFLLADLFCCAFVLTVFYSFYNKRLNEKTAYTSIIVGLIGGFLLFPTPDFSKSLLVGFILPEELFPDFVLQSLLFLSFLIATFIPAFIWKLR